MGRIYDPGRPYLRETVERLAASDHVSVVRQLAESLGEAGHDEHLPWRAGRLDDRRTRRAAAAALSRYGDRALTVLLARVDDEALSTRSRNLAARALAGIATPRCVVAVVERLDTTALGLKYQLVKTLSKLRTQDGSLGFPATEVRRAIEGAAQARRALGSVGEQLSRTTEGPATDLLRRAIDEKREQQLKIVFRCLALLYPARDLYNAYLGYMSGAPGPRSSALEFLENILVRGDRELIIPLLDEHAPEAASGPRGASVEDGAGDPTRRLLGWSDPWLRACATHTLLGSTDAETREVVRELCRDPDPVVRETAEKVLAGSG
jgi:hypothetical protein